MPLTRAPIPHLPAGLVAAEAVLCPLTGFAAWLVWRRIDAGLDRKRAALRRWGWMLLLGGLWPGFVPATPDLALPVLSLLACLVLGAWTTVSFRKLHVNAGFLMLPYLACVATDLVVVTTRF